MRLPRASLLASSMTLAVAGLASTAAANPSASMTAAFTPERLGSPTTVSMSFQIASSTLPAPVLTGVHVAYPANLGLATSGLGVAACSPETVEELGPGGCPANSRMGTGTAVIQVAFGSDLVHENVSLALFAGPSPDGFLHLLISATGVFPVDAQVVMAGVLSGGRLNITVPPIPSLPAAPYVAVSQMHLTLGGRLTYYEHAHGRTTSYHPSGVGLPRSCPPHGFAFAASFAFGDGSSSTATAAVPCPKHRRPTHVKP